MCCMLLLVFFEIKTPESAVHAHGFGLQKAICFIDHPVRKQADIETKQKRPAARDDL